MRWSSSMDDMFDMVQKQYVAEKLDKLRKRGVSLDEMREDNEFNDRMGLLHHAAYNGRMDFLDYLLFGKIGDEYGDDAPGKAVVDVLEPTGKKQKTALHLAASGGHLQCFQAILRAACPDDDDNGEKKKLALLMKDYDGHTALHTAARKGQLAIVHEILKGESDLLMDVVNEKSLNTEKTAFHYAVWSGNMECFREFIAYFDRHAASFPSLKKTQLMTEDKTGWTILDLAALSGSNDMVVAVISELELLDKQNAVEREGKESSVVADAGDQQSILRQMVLHRAEPSNLTCLHKAGTSNNQNVENFRTILNLGCKNDTDRKELLHAQGSRQENVLHVAIEYKKWLLVHEIISNWCTRELLCAVSAHGSDSRNILQMMLSLLSLFNGSIFASIIAKLQEEGSEVTTKMLNAKNTRGETLIHLAAANGIDDAFKVILSTTTTSGRCAFRSLLAKTASEERTVLHVLTINHNIPMINLILKSFSLELAGIDEEENDNENADGEEEEAVVATTTTTTATTTTIQALVSPPPPPSSSSQLVERKGRIATTLLLKSQFVNAVDSSKSTILHLACQCTNPNITVEILRQDGVVEKAGFNQILARDAKGNTALHYAFETYGGDICSYYTQGNEPPEITKLIEKCGNIKNNGGETALHALCRSNPGEVGSYFRDSRERATALKVERLLFLDAERTPRPGVDVNLGRGLL